jgi:hypothetical protein
MTQIVSSTYKSYNQADGRLYLEIVFVLDDGSTTNRTVLVAGDTDILSFIADMTISIDQDLVNAV